MTAVTAPEAPEPVVEGEAGGVYTVRSGDRRYRVSLNLMRCTCPGAAGGRVCRHLRMVAARHELR